MILLEKLFQNNQQLQKWKFNRSLSIQHSQQKKQYAQLLKILMEKKIHTFFQPIISVIDGKTIGYEALNRPIKTKIFSSTEQFYHFLGDTDQVFQFEKLTRQQSIEKYVEQKSQDNYGNKDFIFLNVHPHVLNDANYKSGKTLRFIEEHGLDPRQIVFEITEKQAVQDYSQFERVLNNYRSQGFKIAIDDVGAGYNSLKTMMYMKPDFIKLDRSFIQNIDKELAKQKLVHLFAQYASQSESLVIAEGVERWEELQFLKAIKVDYAQGYYIGRPSENLMRPLESAKIVNY